MIKTFHVIMTKKFERDLAMLTRVDQIKVLEKSGILKINPFPEKKLKKRIQGIKSPLYRLRIDLAQDSFRVFYSLDAGNIYLLRLVSKKAADRVMRSLR